MIIDTARNMDSEELELTLYKATNLKLISESKNPESANSKAVIQHIET